MTDSQDLEGIQFPIAEGGRRATSAAGKAVLSAAVRSLDPTLAAAIESEGNWRKHYGRYLVDLIQLAVRSGDAAESVVANGLSTLHESFEFHRDGEAMTPREAMRRFHQPRLHTAVVTGSGRRQTRLTVPYKGEALAGDALRRQLDAWVEAGIMETSAAEALRCLCENQAWLDLRDLNFAMLGAAAEVGPAEVLSGLGATLVAVDLDRPSVWRRLLAIARAGAGKMVFPTREPLAPDASDEQMATSAGANLLTMAPEIRTWLVELNLPVCIGGYAYLHGPDHVRVEVAMDAIMEDLAARRSDTVLAFLLTPTDVFLVPEDALEASRRHFARASISRLWQAPMRRLTGGRFYAQNLRRELIDPSGRRYGLYDGIVPPQGPNYALAKRVQKWRALSARAAGHRVSANVAPSTATASVLMRRDFAAAFAGAGYYGVEIFQPATTNAIMAALLIHDIRNDSTPAHPGVALDHPLELFMDNAVHGGLWRIGLQLRSVLEIAAVRGFLAGGGKTRA